MTSRATLERRADWRRRPRGREPSRRARRSGRSAEIPDPQTKARWIVEAALGRGRTAHRPRHALATSYADSFILLTGRSDRQVRSIADAIVETLKAHDELRSASRANPTTGSDRLQRRDRPRLRPGDAGHYDSSGCGGTPRSTSRSRASRRTRPWRSTANRPKTTRPFPPPEAADRSRRRPTPSGARRPRPARRRRELAMPDPWRRAPRASSTRSCPPAASCSNGRFARSRPPRLLPECERLPGGGGSTGARAAAASGSREPDASDASRTPARFRPATSPFATRVRSRWIPALKRADAVRPPRRTRDRRARGGARRKGREGGRADRSRSEPPSIQRVYASAASTRSTVSPAPSPPARTAPPHGSPGPCPPDPSQASLGRERVAATSTGRSAAAPTIRGGAESPSWTTS